MGPEIVIAIAAAFISGGAIGSAGTLLAQWILKGVGSGPEPARRALDPERDILRHEVAELHKHLRNMDARLDFTERLLDGAIPISPPPERMPAPELRGTTADEVGYAQEPGPEGAGAEGPEA